MRLSGFNGSFIDLPVIFGRKTGRTGNGRNAHVGANVGTFAAFTGAYHNLDKVAAVMHDSQNAVQFAQGIVAHKAIVPDLNPQACHTVGGSYDIVFAAAFCQKPFDKFFVAHNKASFAVLSVPKGIVNRPSGLIQ